MKKVYILFLIAFLLPGYMMAQVTFTQTTTDDFEKGFHDNVLVGSGDVYLPEKGSDPGTWVSTTVLPAPLTGHEIVTYKGWAYLVGGFNGSSNTSAVYRAPIQAAGVGTWTGLTSLPVALRDHAVVVGVSYIYVLGGIVNGNPSDQIYYAQLNTDGSIGSWQTSSVALPQALWGHSAKYINGYILVVGGADEISTTDASDAVYYASVDPLGALSEFSATASLPQTRNGHTMVSYGGMLYVLGGYDNTGTKHSTVYYSGIDLDGTCSGWLSADVPVAVSNHASVCYNGLMTVICGDVGGAVPLTRKVYWADIDESPNFNWILSASELYYRRKDGQAFVSNGQIIFSGGEELAGTPINVSRYSLLTMDTEKVNEGGFVSFPFPLGSEKNVDNIDYDITYNAGDNNYEIFYRLAGNDAVWGSWVSGGQNNPVLIGQSKAYVQYRFDFSATNDQEITFNELDLNIVGYTELSGDLNSIATLTQANSPYWATANIWFTAGTHTIEPGVTIVFSPNTGLEIGQASLTCEGTEANPILLNYYNDEEIGMWNGVYFNENSDNGVTSSLAYTSIENAGLGSRNANLYCYNTNQPHITYCGFRYAVGNGIRLEGSNVTFDVAAMVENTENGLYLNNSNPNLSHVELGLNGNAGLYYAGAGLTPTFNTCTINENTYGIYSPTPNNSFAPPAASSYTLVDNETDIAIGGGTITADRTWAYFEQGYAILGSVTIKGNGYNPRLTLDPAATLKFATATNMQIGGSASEGGELYAEGSLGWEITFTSLNGEIGGWNGLYFTDGSDSYSSSSSLKYCVVEKASDYNLYSYNTHEPFILYSEFKEAGNRGIVLSNSDISIEETGLFNNANYGLYLVASSPSLVLVDMNGNGTAGVYYGDATCDPTYFSCNIMNSDFGIRYYTCNTSFSESTINGTVEFINVVAGIAMPGGVIDASRTWAYNELNYAILGDIDIYSGNNPRLTIEPGNTIKIAVGVRLDVAHTSTSNNNSYRGGLYAEGTAESPITFTSLSDTIGGWEGLVFFQNSDYNGASSSLQNCIFEKANSYNVHAQYTNQPVIDSCIFRDAAGIGLYCYDADLSVSNSSLVNNYTGIQSNISQPVFTNCEISDNEMYELYAVNPDGFPAFVNSTINTSAKSGSIILVGGGQQTISRSWPYFDGDYVVSATIEIWNFGSPSLTITPGNTIKFSKDVKIDIARYTGSHDSYRGSLIANGTADNPILFTALNDSIGGWDGLQFNDCSDLSGTTSSLKNCTIEKAEGRNILSQNTNQPTIDSCLMQNSGGIGLYCYYSSLSVGNSTIINNQTGIRSDNGQSTFTNCEINSNEQQELFAVNPDGFPTFISSTISTSGKNESVILVGGGQQTISRSWPYFDGDYVVSATIEIWNFGSPSLTIAPGNTIKFSKDVKIDIARYTGSHDSYRGSLIANGTLENPILFTALNDTIGGWDGLQFNDCSDLSGSTSSLKNCTIEKAEGRNILSQSTNQPAIDSCLIWNSGGIGLYCYYSSLSVGNSIIINNQTGIRSDNGQPTFTNCEINSNEQQELYAVNPNGFPTFVNSTISTSAKNESIILVGGGQQTISRSWPYFDGDYVVLSTITLWHNDIPTITIAPGNTIKFSKDTKIDIAYPTGSHNTYRGRLWAEGTADMPITFTALNDSAGGWDGLSFNQSTSLSGAASSLKHCIIEKASGFNVKSQYTSQPAIDSCIFRNSTGFGLQIYYASPVITNSQIIDNSSYGIYLSGTCSPTIGNTPGSGCDLFDNGIYDIYNNTTNNINARHNFWNTLDSALVAHRVYDKYDNSGLGEVYFYPFSYEGFNSLDTLNQINGKLMYANADSSSMPNTKLYIITEANVVKDSTTTDINGNYFFTGLSNSFCQFTIPNYFGGVNSTDALMILQHFAHVINLEGINLLAADVNGSNTVNSTDALFVMKRFVHLIDEFPVGDWIMRPDIYPLILYNDTVQSDLLSLCYGDVDASFISGGKRDGLEIEMIHETEMVVNSWQKYRIPVRIKKDAVIGAVSLELLYPENCLDISRASLMSNQQQMISYSNNGTTRLAWADLSPLAMNKDDLFIELTVETKDLSTQRGDISIGIGLNSEMVNPEVNIIQDVVLSIPLLVNNENESRHRFDQSQDELFMSVHPNPFRQQTTIEYTVPEGGRVLISIQKIDHSRKIELLNQSERAGNHQFVFDGAQYPEGIYLCTIQISTGNNVWFDSEKLMLKR